MPKIQATRPHSKKSKRKVTHIRVTKAANGFTVHHEREPEMTRQPGGAMRPQYGQPDPKPAVFKDRQEMLDHVGGLSDEMGENEPVQG